MIAPGKLNKRTDVSGGEVWAGIWPMKASEIVRAEATTMNITHRIRIRYRGGIKPSWRIRFGNRYFSIVQGPLNPDEKNEKLEIYCREVT
jgi:SPP1 family predicted phage head-tail adaptor